MQPVQLLQSGSVVIIGNDALHVSFHSKPFTATFHSRSHTQVTHCTLLRLILPCIFSSTLQCPSSNTEHSDACRSRLLLQNDAFKQ